MDGSINDPGDDGSDDVGAVVVSSTVIVGPAVGSRVGGEEGGLVSVIDG